MEKSKIEILLFFEAPDGTVCAAVFLLSQAKEDSGNLAFELKRAE